MEDARSVRGLTGLPSRAIIPRPSPDGYGTPANTNNEVTSTFDRIPACRHDGMPSDKLNRQEGSAGSVWGREDQYQSLDQLPLVMAETHSAIGFVQRVGPRHYRLRELSWVDVLAAKKGTRPSGSM